MATIYLDRSGAATNLRAIFSAGGQYLPTAGGALEAHSGTAADYYVAAASTVALDAALNRHGFTVPVPTVRPVTLEVVILDIVAHSIAGSAQIRLDPAGVEVVDLIDGKTIPAALQIACAAVAGKITGAGTGTETFKGLDGTSDRLVVTVDASGNRSVTTYP